MLEVASRSIKRLRGLAKAGLLSLDRLATRRDPTLTPEQRAVKMACASPEAFPSHLMIEPTTRCSLRCVMCGRTYWKRPDKPDMSLDLFKRTVSAMSGLRMITIQGLGEPLLHKQLIEMVEFARSLGLITRFNTSLCAMTDKIAERLVKAGHCRIDFSIETTDAATYADIRRGTTRATVLGNLDKIMAAKRRAHAWFPVVNAHAVLMRATLPQIPKLIADLDARGVNKLSFADMCTAGLDLGVVLRDGSRLSDNRLSELSAEQMASVIAAIKAVKTRRMKVLAPGDWGGGLNRPSQASTAVLTCKELWDAPFVTSDGHVTPCCFLPDQSLMDMGDLSKNPFREIWRGEAYERLRLAHLSGRPPKHCATCQQRFWTYGPAWGASIQREIHGCFLNPKTVNESSR